MCTHQYSPVTHLTRTEKLGHEIARQAAHIHAATYRFLILVREFDALGGWGDQGCVSCAHWLSWRCGISLHTGREKLRVAKALAGLPMVRDAFEQGRISYSKARAITRVADEHNEAFLLGIALNGTASQLDRLVRHESRRRRSSARQDAANDAYQQRDIEWFEDDHGCVVFKVCLPKEQATRVIKAIDACQDQRFGDGVIPIAAAKRICCDAGIVPIVEDAEGRMLDVGRRTRVIPPAVRRALNKRDDHSCRFPGCTHTRYLHGHHIVHWADGGQTKLDNLVLLCSHHHHRVHDDGFGCARVHGAMLFTTLDGAVLPTAVALRGLDQLGESAQTIENDLANFAIHKDTCLPNYHGDGMDYDMALQALAQLGQ